MDRFTPTTARGASAPIKGSGWHRFFQALVRRRIKEPARRFYTRHAEKFCDAFRETGLKSLTKPDLTRYLSDAGWVGLRQILLHIPLGG